MVQSDGMFDPSLLAPDKPRRIKRDEFLHLASLGAFDDERVELLYGTIVEMSPPDPQHDSPIMRLTMLIVPPLVGRAFVRVQLSYVAEEDSVPVPDIAIVPFEVDYAREHPTKAHLAIEIAFSSHRKDRLIKAPLYAASGVAEYWIVDAKAQTIDVLRDSDGTTYRSEGRHGLDATLSPVAFPDVVIRVAEVFG